MVKNNALLPVVLAGALLLPAAAAAQDKEAPRRLAAIHLSDGEVLTGQVLLTPGVNFSLAALPKLDKDFVKKRSFNVNQIREMSFWPWTLSPFPPERMKEPFKWDVKDRTKKIVTGKPYPIRELACTVKFTNGQEMTGVLASIALYLEVVDEASGEPGQVRKFLLKQKQSGKSGHSLSDLVYVTRIRMLDEGTKVAAKLDVELLACKLGPKDELSAITRESLEGVPTKRAGKPDHYEVSSTFGENIFLAARKDGKYVVGWPAEGTRPTKLFKDVEKHTKEVRDYFTDRKVLGILPNASGTEVLALVSLRRRVPKNAYKGECAPEFDEKGNPMEFFRVSVWLWKRDPTAGHMILAKRGSFFRVRVDVKAPTPTVEVTPDLWPILLEGDRVTVGKAAGRVGD
jgi:hypothetical protein